MDPLTLRPTTAQLRNLALATCASGLVAAFLTHEHLGGHDGSDRILGWGIAFTAAALLMAGVTVAYSRAVTECTDTGIRARGLGLERRWCWNQVSDVSIRIGNRGYTRTVMLTLTEGKQVLLGAPVAGGLMPDRDFDRKVGEIQQFWRCARGRDSGDAAIAVVPPRSYRVTARSRLVGLVTLVALGLISALPVLAREGGPALLVRLGQGQPGSFTAYYYSCSGSCAWIGEFTPTDSSARREGVTLAPGASFPQIGGRVSAVDVGSAGQVYPAGGGTSWIPLAITLTLTIAWLTVDALWVTSRIRQRRSQHTRQSGPDPPVAAVQLGGSPRPVLARTVVASGSVVLVAAGTIAAILFWPLPSPARPPAAARACASYGEWLATQSGTTQPWTDKVALARAAQLAPNDALGNDLSALLADVAAAAQYAQGSADPANVVAEAEVTVNVTTDIQAVSHDCFG
jgi:hypothetical protein